METTLNSKLNFIYEIVMCLDETSYYKKFEFTKIIIVMKIIHWRK